MTRKIQARTNDNQMHFMSRVAYQCPTDVTWGGETLTLAGRTLEEAFALENLTWCQDKVRKPLQLRIAKANEKDLATLAERIHKRVQAKSFGKTDFALALATQRKLLRNGMSQCTFAMVYAGLRGRLRHFR